MISSLLFFVISHAFAKSERSIVVSETQVAEIQTALGYSTLIQFDSRPSSVVIGDQDAFKIEYLGNSLTLKPVIYGSRTNLFVFTEYEKFSFRLIAGKPENADYLVKVKRRESKAQLEAPISTRAVTPSSTSMTEVPLFRRVSCQNVSFGVNSVAYPKDKPWLLINFSLSMLRAHELGTLSFTAEDLTVTDQKTRVPIETLYLQKLQLAPDGQPVNGSLLIPHASAKTRANTRVSFTPNVLAGAKCYPLTVRLDLGKGKKK